MSATLVVGIGNASRGDDAAGLEVARRLRALGVPGVDVLACDGEPGALLEAFAGRERVIVVDAAGGGRAPGRVHRFDARTEPLPVGLARGSTHGFGLAEAVELGRGLGLLPPALVVYALELRRFAPGRPLSPQARSAVARACERVLAELRAPREAARARA